MSDFDPINQPSEPANETDLPVLPAELTPVVSEASAPAPDTYAADQATLTMRTHAAMLKDLRSWGFWLLGLGVLQFVGSSLSLDPTWGILLLIVGAGSFLFPEVAMYVVYGVTLAWAAINNAIGGLGSGGWGWAAFAAFQVYLAFTVFRNYVKYRRNQAAYDRLILDGHQTATFSRSARFFSFIGCGMAALGGIATLAFLAALIVVAVTEQELPLTAVKWLVGISVDFLVIGLAVSLSAVLGRFRYRALPILGCIGAALILAVWMLLLVLP